MIYLLGMPKGNISKISKKNLKVYLDNFFYFKLNCKGASSVNHEG